MKLVLVEDEEIIREGILGSIDWRALGIEVAGQAEDGEQAEALIDRTRPDIVVSDIRVPFVDGLTLAERVTRKYPGTAIVIISGFDDFAYAQRALKMGVEDYVLKPIDLPAFTQVLQKVRAKLEKRAREAREMEELRSGAARSQLILRGRLLRDLIAGRLSDEEAARRLPHLFTPGKWFTVMMVGLDEADRAVSSPEDRSRLERSLEETLQALASRGMLLLEEAGGEFTLGGADRDRELLSRQVASAERAIRRSASAFPAGSVTVGIGGMHEGIAGLKVSHREAAEAAACRYILGPGRTIGRAEVERLTGGGTAPRLFHDAELVWAVKLGDRRALHENLARLLQELSRAGDRAANYLQLHVASIFLGCLDAVVDEGGVVEEVFADPMAVYNGILSEGTAAGALETLEGILGEIASYLETDRSGGQRHLIEKAKRYIRRNFGRSDLGLEEVAEFVHLSPSYFSSVFSGAEGRSFIDYLSDLRIQRAMDLLLRSPYHAGEIADMVGYASPTYFSSAFKKNTGLSPGEFRKKAGRSSPEEPGRSASE